MQTLQQHYLDVVRALGGHERKPVDEQLAEARAAVGVDVAAQALRERVVEATEPHAKLIDLRAERRRRAS